MTGAAGFVGSHLADALVAAGHEVVGIDSYSDSYDRELKEENARGLDVLRLDLAEDAIDLSGFDGVFHLAGQPGVRSFGDVFPLYVRNNVLASQRLFEAAVESSVRVVFSSSSSVYGAAERFPTPEDTVPEPISPYAITKLAAEHLARAYERSFGLDVVVLRYFNAFGPRQRPDMAFTRIAFALAEGRPFDLYGDGSADARLHVRRRRGRGDGAGDGPRARSVQRRRRRRGLDAGRDRAVRTHLRTAARAPRGAAGARRPAPHARRHDADSRRARVGAPGLARGRVVGSVGVGFG